MRDCSIIFSCLFVKLSHLFPYNVTITKIQEVRTVDKILSFIIISDRWTIVQQREQNSCSVWQPIADRIDFFAILPLALRRCFASNRVRPSSRSRAGTVGRIGLHGSCPCHAFGIEFMTFQFYHRISSFLSRPTVAHYQIAYNRSLPFVLLSPSACPEIRVGRKYKSLG